MQFNLTFKCTHLASWIGYIHNYLGTFMVLLNVCFSLDFCIWCKANARTPTSHTHTMYVYFFLQCVFLLLVLRIFFSFLGFLNSSVPLLFLHCLGLAFVFSNRMRFHFNRISLQMENRVAVSMVSFEIAITNSSNFALFPFPLFDFRWIRFWCVPFYHFPVYFSLIGSNPLNSSI